jgi:hypothetical protein
MKRGVSRFSIATAIGSAAALVVLAWPAVGVSAHPAFQHATHAQKIACSSGSVRAVIGGKVRCLKPGAACKTKYNRAYRKHGFNCVGGHLVRIPSTPPPLPPPPPPPPPIAEPGHYKGMTSQNEDFEFDVTSDGGAITNLKTGQVNQSCTPDQGGLYAGNLDFGSNAIPLQTDSSFRIDQTFMSEVAFEDKHTDPDTIHLVITGHFSGAVASGTFLETTQFTEQGTAFTCSSNPQTWSATKTG